MAIPLNNVIEVNITRETRAVTQKGFGIPLILGSHTRFPEGEVRSYSNISEVEEDFQSGDIELEKAQAIFSQEITPQQIKIGRRKTPVQQVVNVTVSNIVNDLDYTVTINGVPFVYTSDADATEPEILNGLQAAIALGSEPVTAVVNVSQIDITADTAGESFTTVVDGNLAVATQVENVGMASDIADAEQIDSDWYFLIITSTAQLDILEAAKSVETRSKFYMGLTREADTKNAALATDTSSLLKAKNYQKTALIYIEDGTSHPDAAWVGRGAPTDPGSINWAYIALSSVVATDMTSTERNAVLNKNTNIFESLGGIDVTFDGRVIGSNTVFIDQIRGVAFIEARIQESIATTLINVDKIPYTNAGMDIIVSKIKKVLLDSVDQGILVDEPERPIIVTRPDILEVSTSDKANRFAGDFEFSAFFAGAINKLKIAGKISV